MTRAFTMAITVVGSLSVLGAGCTLQHVFFGGGLHTMSANDARVLTYYEAHAPASASAQERCDYWRAVEAATRQRTDLSEQANRLMKEHTQAVCRRASEPEPQSRTSTPETATTDAKPSIELPAQRLVRCDTGCAGEFRDCVHGPGGTPDREVCVSTYQACQAQCEAEFNAAGFCVERNILTGKPTGAVGPCP